MGRETCLTGGSRRQEKSELKYGLALTFLVFRQIPVSFSVHDLPIWELRSRLEGAGWINFPDAGQWQKYTG